MKKKTRKLRLNSETVRTLDTLDAGALQEMRGATLYTGFITCVTCYDLSRCRPCYV